MWQSNGCLVTLRQFPRESSRVRHLPSVEDDASAVIVNDAGVFIVLSLQLTSTTEYTLATRDAVLAVASGATFACVVVSIQALLK